MRSMLVISLVILLSLLSNGSAYASTYVVKPDGTGDFPTIQAAIDAALPGDIIQLTNGTFKGVGNRDIDFKGKNITVCSQSGRPESCIIDPEGIQWVPQRAFDFKNNEGNDSIVRDITIINGITEDC